MQATFVSAGVNIDHTPASALNVGDVVVQGALVGVAPRAIAANELGTLCVSGLFDIVKANEQQSPGAAVYWDADGNPYGGDAGTGCLTTTSSGNTFAGFVTQAAAATDPVARTLLLPPKTVTNTVHAALSAAIADPGNAGAIPVTDTGTCPIVTTGAQTRTLAAPTYAGQMLLLQMKTDGGDCVITCATGVNQTGNNTITLNDAGDTLLLAAIEVGADKRWRVVVNDGCTLATV